MFNLLFDNFAVVLIDSGLSKFHGCFVRYLKITLTYQGYYDLCIMFLCDSLIK